jgi:hypothetical protein
VGFENTIAVLERAKTVRALDRSATAIGICVLEIAFLKIDKFESQWGQEFSLLHIVQDGLRGPAHSPIHWAPGA